MKNNRKAKRQLSIGFVMDPPKQLLFWEDTSVSIMEELTARGHRCYYIEPKAIYTKNNKVYARSAEVDATLKEGFAFKDVRILHLGSLDIIFNRLEPPFDIHYLHLTQILDLIPKRVFQINTPTGIRKANEKLYILNFEKHIPKTMVSKNPSELLAFSKQYKNGVVLKPLEHKGGKGIELLKKPTLAKLKLLTQNGRKWMMAQRFLQKGLLAGDKRVLLLNGKALGQFTRIPRSGEFRSNISLGGTIRKAQLNQRERSLINSIAPTLRKDGLCFVGLDLIDGKLIELNVTSPAGIPELNKLTQQKPQVHVARFLERLF